MARLNYKKITICHLIVLTLCLPLNQSYAGAPVPSNEKSAMGVNFWFFWPYQYTWPFTNFFNTVAPFYSTASGGWSDDNRVLLLDSLGYPKSLLADQDATVQLFNDASNRYPSGDWTLFFDGEGEFGFSFGSWSVKSKSPGAWVLTVPALEQGIFLKITKTTVGNHIRNIRLIPPGFETTYKDNFFHPLFLERLKPFKVLRFMDWMSTNVSLNDKWENRTKPKVVGQSNERGVCLEYMIRLCNATNSDGWFNIPHKADDDFIRKFVTMVRDSLKPGNKAYFEWSNEVWNGMFQSQGYCRTMGEAMGQNTGWGAIQDYWALRMNAMFKIVEDVYAGQMNRCVRVIGTQVGNTGVLDGLLERYESAKHADVVAVAPYYNPGDVNSGVEAVIAAVTNSATQVDKVIANDLAIAKRNNLRIVAYESGLDIWSVDKSIQEQVRFDPRMKAINKSYWTKWRAGGGTLIVQYTFCDPGWGLLKQMNQNPDEAPGYQAALEWIAENPVWWDDKRPTVGVNDRVPGNKIHYSVLPQDNQIFSLDGRRISKNVKGLTPAGLYIKRSDGAKINVAPHTISR